MEGAAEAAQGAIGTGAANLKEGAASLGAETATNAIESASASTALADTLTQSLETNPLEGIQHMANAPLEPGVADKKIPEAGTMEETKDPGIKSQDAQNTNELDQLADSKDQPVSAESTPVQEMENLREKIDNGTAGQDEISRYQELTNNQEKQEINRQQELTEKALLGDLSSDEITELANLNKGLGSDGITPEEAQQTQLEFESIFNNPVLGGITPEQKQMVEDAFREMFKNVGKKESDQKKMQEKMLGEIRKLRKDINNLKRKFEEAEEQQKKEA